MKNADMPAAPFVLPQGVVAQPYIGLTKREMMAMHMMAALLVGCDSPNNDFIASISVDATERLLAELDLTAK